MDGDGGKVTMEHPPHRSIRGDYREAVSYYCHDGPQIRNSDCHDYQIKFSFTPIVEYLKNTASFSFSIHAIYLSKKVPLGEA